MSRLDPMVAANSWDDVQSTIKTYEKKIKSDLIPVNRRQPADTRLMSSTLDSNRKISKNDINKLSNKLNTALDMLPILASTGESALEVGIKRQTALKLPIFKLPALDQAHVTSILKQQEEESPQYRRMESYSAPIDAPKEKFQNLKEIISSHTKIASLFGVVYRIPIKFLFALGNISKTLSAAESVFTQRHLDMTPSDVNDVEDELHRLACKAELEEQICIQNNIKMKRFKTKGMKLVHLLGASEDSNLSVTVFMKIKLIEDRKREEERLKKDKFAAVNATTSGDSVSNVSIDELSSTMLTKSKKNSNKPTDLVSLLGSIDLKSTVSAKSNKSKQSATGLISTFNPTIAKKVPMDRNSQKKYEQKQTDDNHALKLELMHSLQNMQQHTDMVKDGILGIRNIMAVADLKAKNYIFTVSSDRLRAALYKVVLKDLYRGYKAWLIVYKKDKISAKITAYIRYHSIRQVATAFARLMHKVLEKKLMRWILFTRKETQRLLEEKKHQASIDIQRIIRGYISRLNVGAIREKKKYEKLYKSVIKIQKLMRGKVVRWRYLRFRRQRRRDHGARVIQRTYRGFKGRRLIRILKLRQNRDKAAAMVQALARGKIQRNKYKILKSNMAKKQSIIFIQRIIRGFLGRCRVQHKKILRVRTTAVVAIQRVIRGVVARKMVNRKRKLLLEMKAERYNAAVKIQKLARGFTGRKKFMTVTLEVRRRFRKEANAATLINNMMRGFLSRITYKKKKSQRYNLWLFNARSWIETWSADENKWYYYNERTQESLWEPPRCGYTKNDGVLVLESGQVLEDPAYSGAVIEEESESLWEQKRKCSECEERVATRACNECGDKFCTKCYKSTHATGTRRDHTYKDTGPIDCSECEDLLSERWCVSCDEAFCDSCWRKVHTRGKRRFHPFCEISSDGRVDPRIFTIDGTQVEDYDATYAQQRADNEAEEAPAEASSEEWTTAYDDVGNIFFYNNFTGVSQYEDPYAY